MSQMPETNEEAQAMVEQGLADWLAHLAAHRPVAASALPSSEPVAPPARRRTEAKKATPTAQKAA